MATTATPVVSGGRPAIAFDLSQVLLGDLIALGGAILYFVAKFLPFLVISITGVQPLANTYNGWNGSRDLLNIFEILAVFAVVIVFAVGVATNAVPELRGIVGLVYGGCGAVLLLLTLIAFLDVRNAFQQAQFLTGGPGIGFFLGLLFALAVGLAGLVKMGILPGNGLISLGSPAPAPGTTMTGSGQPFASGHYAPGAQQQAFPPPQQSQQSPQQFPQGDNSPPAAPPRPQGAAPPAPGYPPPSPPSGYGPPGGQGGPPGASGEGTLPRR